MKISESGMFLDKQIANQMNKIPVTGRQQLADSRQDSISPLPLEFSGDKLSNISLSELQSLKAEISELGINFSELDADCMLRAVLLHRNNIPIDLLVLTDNWEREPSVFEVLAVLKEHAYTVLRDGGLPAEIQTAIEVLIRNIESLSLKDNIGISIRFSLDNIIESWANSLEADLRRIVYNILSNDYNSTDAHHQESLKNLEGIMHSFSEDMGDHLIGSYIESLRDAISEFQIRIRQLPIRKAEIQFLLKQTVAALSERLSIIGANLEVYLTSGDFQTLSTGMLSVFFEEQIRELEHKLSSVFNDETPDVLLPLSSKTDSNISGLQTMLQKSGMAFEWYLLAWYRSGKDLAQFQALIHENLKGILFNFVESMKKQQTGSYHTSSASKLEHDAQSVIDNIARRQIANCLNLHTERGGLYLEIPFGEKDNQGNAKIRVSGFKKQGENTLDSKNIILTLNVEMTRLGKVKTNIAFSGNAISLRFTLRDERIRTLAGDMEEEIRDSLKAKGFVIQNVDFKLEGEETERDNTTANSKQMRNVNIVG